MLRYDELCIGHVFLALPAVFTVVIAPLRRATL